MSNPSCRLGSPSFSRIRRSATSRSTSPTRYVTRGLFARTSAEGVGCRSAASAEALAPSNCAWRAGTHALLVLRCVASLSVSCGTDLLDGHHLPQQRQLPAPDEGAADLLALLHGRGGGAGSLTSQHPSQTTVAAGVWVGNCRRSEEWCRTGGRHLGLGRLSSMRASAQWWGSGSEGQGVQQAWKLEQIRDGALGRALLPVIILTRLVCAADSVDRACGVRNRVEVPCDLQA